MSKDLSEQIESLSFLADARRRFKQNKAAMFFSYLLLFFCAMAILGPMLSHYTYSKITLLLRRFGSGAMIWGAISFAASGGGRASRFPSGSLQPSLTGLSGLFGDLLPHTSAAGSMR